MFRWTVLLPLVLGPGCGDLQACADGFVLAADGYCYPAGPADTGETTGEDAYAACLSYIEAYSACATEAAGQDMGIDPSLCEDYRGLSGEAGNEAAALMACYAEVYNSADCSTSEAFSAAADALELCA